MNCIFFDNTFTQEPGMVYRCYGETVRCPGGEPGVCADGRDCGFGWKRGDAGGNRSANVKRYIYIYCVMFNMISNPS